MESYKKFVGVANTFAKWICIVSLSVMTVMIILQVIFRYVVQSSLSFSEEVARYMFIWSVFVGSALALKARSHVSIEIVVANLPRLPKRMAIVVSNLLSFIFYLLLFVFGIGMTLFTIDQTSPTMSWLSMSLVYLAVPVSAFILMANLAMNAYEEFMNPDIIKSEGAE